MNLDRRLVVVMVLLLATVGLRAFVSSVPPVPVRQRLENFPTQLGDWRMAGEEKITESVMKVLKADDTLNRRYRDNSGHYADVFIAYYEMQAAGESMHSPKNCLPGSGWAPVANDYITIQREGKPVEINRYVIEKDNDRSLVLYWYQAGGRIIANEYWGKFYLVSDALRTQRRDGSIVRLVIPLQRRDDPERLTALSVGLAERLMAETPKFLP